MSAVNCTGTLKTILLARRHKTPKYMKWFTFSRFVLWTRILQVGVRYWHLATSLKSWKESFCSKNTRHLLWGYAGVISEALHVAVINICLWYPLCILS